MVKFNRSVDLKQKAYWHVYLKNRKKYPLAFEEYEICFLDGSKSNINTWNLFLLTPEEAAEYELETLRIWELKKSN